VERDRSSALGAGRRVVLVGLMTIIGSLGPMINIAGRTFTAAASTIRLADGAVSTPSPQSAAPSESLPNEVLTSTAPAVEASALSLLRVGGLLAAGVISGLAWRRRPQQLIRPLGRRIVHRTPPSQPVEVALRHRQRPLRAVSNRDWR
jgi:hypothetical protein